jgi:hypothetical protein
MRGYTEHTAMSLLDCFKVDCAAVADQLTFDQTTGTVTTQFANMDNFLDCVEIELGSDDDANSVNKFKDGKPRQTLTFELSEHAKASLASALNDPDMDLAANLHASTKSFWTNFSSSTGNSTNRLVNTKQFSSNHKAHALVLARECKKLADMEHTNQALYSRVKELEETLARGGPLVVENNPPTDESSTHAGISFVDQNGSRQPISPLRTQGIP